MKPFVSSMQEDLKHFLEMSCPSERSFSQQHGGCIREEECTREGKATSLKLL